MKLDPKVVRSWMKTYQRISMRLRRTSKRKLCFLATILVSFFVIYLLYEWKILCTNHGIQRSLDTVCDQYASGKAFGNLCRAICVKNKLQAESCQTMHSGKEVVFSAMLDDSQPVFVKGRRLDFLSDENENLFWTDVQGKHIFPSATDFESMVRSYLDNNMGIKLAKDDDLLKILWFESTSPFVQDETSTNVMDWKRANVWSLIQDNEYVLTKLYSHLDVFPTLYGTCGGLYVVEALEPLAFPSFFYKLSFGEWAKRVSVALAMLDLLDELDSVLDDPVHLCDVKPDHFGISDVGRVKFLDLDSVYLRTNLGLIMDTNSTCQKHSDCDFFDCKGQCDLIKKVCINGVVNNNLQVVCEKVLSARSSKTGLPLKYPGLITAKHLNKRLKTLLSRCSNPTGSKDGIRLEAPADIRIELYKGLREVLDIARHVDHSEEDLRVLDKEM